MTLTLLPPHDVTHYELAHMSDERLLELQVNTLAIAPDARNEDDVRLLDRIGRHWRARKSASTNLSIDGA